MDDFGFEGQGSLDIEDGSKVKNGDGTGTEEERQHLDDDGSKEKSTIDNHDDNGDSDKDKGKEEDADKDKGNGKEISLTEGQIVEIGDDSYTVDKDGNLVDKDGKIFKEAKDVSEFLKEFDVDDSTDEHALNIENIQKALGYELTGDDDKPIEFENNIEGITAYVNGVINAQKEEITSAAVNAIFQKYPILEDVLNYYVANGNSLEGFGELPDRSNITVDDTNEAQQESIIRAAWKEQKRSGDVESYINYLKASNTLVESAKIELAALQKSDKDRRDEIARQAKQQQDEYNENLKNYWKGVSEVINSRKIAGYEIPEHIIINRDGRKVTATPKDFFNYLYVVDKDGHSAYEKDLAKKTLEERRNDEILRAYLTFAGGDYSSLVDMAVKETTVSKLRIKAKDAKKTAIRVKPATTNAKANFDFGF